MYNTRYMTDRKITEGALEHGSFQKILNKQARIANLSEAGRERLAAALRAGVATETRKHGLQYGLGDTHIEALKKFPRSEKYADHHLLKPKELRALENSLDIFFKSKAIEPKVEKEREVVPPARIETRTPTGIEPKQSEMSPRPAASDDTYQKPLRPQ